VSQILFPCGGGWFYYFRSRLASLGADDQGGVGIFFGDSLPALTVHCIPDEKRTPRRISASSNKACSLEVISAAADAESTAPRRRVKAVCLVMELIG